MKKIKEYKAYHMKTIVDADIDKYIEITNQDEYRKVIKIVDDYLESTNRFDPNIYNTSYSPKANKAKKVYIRTDSTWSRDLDGDTLKDVIPIDLFLAHNTEDEEVTNESYTLI